MVGEGAGMGSLRPLDTPLTDLLAPLGVMAGPGRYWPQAKFKARSALQSWLGQMLGAQTGARNRIPEVMVE